MTERATFAAVGTRHPPARRPADAVAALDRLMAAHPPGQTIAGAFFDTLAQFLPQGGPT